MGTALGWLGTTRGDILEYGRSGVDRHGTGRLGLSAYFAGLGGRSQAYGTLPASSITSGGTLPALTARRLVRFQRGNITSGGTLPALNAAALTSLSAANITPGGTLPALNGSALTGPSGANVSGTVSSATTGGHASISANPTNAVLTNSIYATYVTSLGASTNTGIAYFGSSQQSHIDTSGNFSGNAATATTASGGWPTTWALSALTQSGAASSQVPQWNGSAWTPVTLSYDALNAALNATNGLTSS